MEFEKQEFNAGATLFDWLLMGALAVLVVAGLLGLAGIAGDMWDGLRVALGAR